MSTPVQKPPEEEWEDPYPQKKRSLQWLPGVILLLALYVLSIGPASRLAQNNTISWDTLHTIYTPVNLACSFAPVDKVVQWYIQDVWQMKASSLQKRSN